MAIRAMIWEDPDAELRRLAGDASFRHRDAARRAVRFRAGGNVADLIAVLDDPHPCGMTGIVFAMAGAARPWLNWVPMPGEAICNLANHVGARRARGESINLTRSALSAAEPASAMTAARKVVGPIEMTGPAPRVARPGHRRRVRGNSSTSAGPAIIGRTAD